MTSLVAISMVVGRFPEEASLHLHVLEDSYLSKQGLLAQYKAYGSTPSSVVFNRWKFISPSSAHSLTATQYPIFNEIELCCKLLKPHKYITEHTQHLIQILSIHVALAYLWYGTH
jgi:hypothetical protein